MGQVKEDIDKVRDFVDKSIKNLENGEYVYLCDGYSGDSSGGKYDYVIQSYSSKIVSKLTSLGYKHTTNHGYGCKDWKFYKDFEI